MRVVNRIQQLRAELDDARTRALTVGLVPTMGALHEGHLSLVRRSSADCDVTVVTIFVNPLQFGPGEDLDAYPRDLEGDVAAAAGAGADLVFAPTAREMYPEPPVTAVTVEPLSSTVEGGSRPGHFSGVATVVAKLFNAAGPCHAYFGEKDFQQLLVVRRMVRDLSFPVEVVACATVRDEDGVALSSRNAYLSSEERAGAPVLRRALLRGRAAIEAGERDASAVEKEMTAAVEAEALARLDYAVVAGADDLEPLEQVSGEVRLLAAAWIGRTRLIDNVGVTVAPFPRPTEKENLCDVG